MNTIKVILAESGRIADLRKDFPLYKGQFNDKLLNVLVPTSLLASDFEIQHYIGQTYGTQLPTSTELNAFLLLQTQRTQATQGDIIDFVLENGEELEFYRYVFNNNDWQQNQVESFAVNNISGTNCKISCLTTERNGVIKQSKTYYMRYLKTLRFENTEYALYERKLPKEFTAYSGEVKIVANIVNLLDGKVESIVTSQVCNLDVLPSTMLDVDESVEPSVLEEIYARFTDLESELVNKQNIIDASLITNAKNIVGAINETKTLANVNAETNNTQDINISDLQTRVQTIEETYTTGENPIGELKGNTEPNTTILNEFTIRTVGRVPKRGDVVIYIQEIQDATDKNFKCMFTASGWTWFEIPPLEKASNGTLGLIQGTYSAGESNNMLVDISDGKIVNIYLKLNSTNVYRTLQSLHQEMKDAINNIIYGNWVVGLASKSIGDKNGNDISTTYMTNTNGATKSFVKNYALPRTFNDIYYINDGGYSKELVDTEISSVVSGVGYTTLFENQFAVDSDFQLSKNNTFNNKIFVSVSRQDQYKFQITTSCKKAGQEWVDLSVDVSNAVILQQGAIHKIEFGSSFDLLDDNIVNLQEGDLIKQQFEVFSFSGGEKTITIYSNSVYPSTFNLNVHTISLTQGRLGEQQVLVLDLERNENNELVGEIPDNIILNDNTMIYFALNYYNNYSLDDLIVIKQGGVEIPLYTRYNSQATCGDLLQCRNATFNNWSFNALFFEGNLIVQMDNVVDKFIGSEYIIVENEENDARIVVELDGTKIETDNAVEDSDNLITSGAVFNEIAPLKAEIEDLKLFKFPNATIIGEPTIDNGQISGFSVNDYLQFPFIVDFRGRPFEIDFEFTTATDVSTQQNILDSNFGLALAIKNGHGLIALSNNGTDWDIGVYEGTYVLNTNTTYMAKLTWDTTQYILSISDNGGETYTTDITINSDLQPFPRTMFIGGASASVVGHTPTYFFGTINLNKAKLSINGLEVWQGMDDAGLSTRATVSLDNIDNAGKKVIQDMIDISIGNLLDEEV